ncbi:histamine N-methyltransferase B-like [Lytechinus variegatus]|uniref:histamine N-methyltransferase B-like n=1 Tax=Lytechinus variegatus TaxID=7654 RepID=UPI001BB2C7D0|nr:histamine N-methyltransferase B-like [Lytechinus variegatus]
MSATDIIPLTGNHERYEDTYYNAFYKIAQKEFFVEKVSQYFDTKVMKILTNAFDRDEEFSILSVGVGEGPHEFHILKSLQTCYASISSVSVDPNESMVQTFKDRVASLNVDNKPPITFQAFNGSLTEFATTSTLARTKYHLITSIHSLYYTADLQTTFSQLTSMMKDDGFIIVVCKKGDLISESFSKFAFLREAIPSYIPLTSTDVKEFAESQGLNVIASDVNMQWDITEVFDDRSDFGNKLLDFFTQTAYFRQTAPSEVVDELMNFWRSISISTEDENGRMLSPCHDEILVISK